VPRNFGLGPLQKVNVDAHLYLMLAAAEQNSADRTDILKIAPKSERNVFLAGPDIVRGVKIDVRRQIKLDP
jgi:hypothetical protein